MSQPFLGEIKAVGFNFPPRGYANCAGQIISIAQNSALFSLLGTAYGGNGVQTFQLPNLGGRVPIGQGQSPGTSNYVIGEVAGTEQVTLNSQQLPAHSHIANTTVTATSTLAATTTINALTAPTARVPSPAGHLLTAGSVTISGTPTIVQNYAAPGTGTAATLDASAATTSLTGGVSATAQTTLQPTGNSLPVSILQPLVAINYVIALQGIFPSRN